MRLKPAQQYVTIPLSILGSGILTELSLIATKTYLVLLLRSDSNRNQCWPSLKRISADANLSLSSVQKAISELEEIGLIVKQHRTTSKGDAASNLYTVMVPDISDQDEPEGIPCDGIPYTETRYTGTPSDGNELKPIELKPENYNTPTGSADAEAPVEPTADTLPDPPKPDPYHAVLDIYELANMPEPPRCEITPLLRAMKQALASGWQPSRIAAAWSNARSRGNPQVWSLAYTLRHLTEAEGLSTRPPGSRGVNKPGEDEIRASVKNAFKDVFGGAK